MFGRSFGSLVPCVVAMLEIVVRDYCGLCVYVLSMCWWQVMGVPIERCQLVRKR